MSGNLNSALNAEVPTTRRQTVLAIKMRGIRRGNGQNAAAAGCLGIRRTSVPRKLPLLKNMKIPMKGAENTFLPKKGGHCPCLLF
jgi:hypothetical protein